MYSFLFTDKAQNEQIESGNDKLQQPLNEEASIEIELDDHIMTQINNSMNPRTIKGSLHRASKPQTPEQLTDNESSSDNSSNPRSRPPSRRGSFLREYSHFGSNDINRKLILNRGRKINNALSSYMSKDRLSKTNKLYTNNSRKTKKKKNPHARQFSNEQLGFPDHLSMSSNTASPISTGSSSKKRKSQKHGRKKSNVEEAADIIRKEQQMRIRQMNQGSDDEMSDDSFAKIRDKFNASIGNTGPPQTIPKRMSQSQPTSPRRYGNEFQYQETPKFETSHSEEKKNTMKPTSIWRKNRNEFLKKMDAKLENAIRKFEGSNTTMFSDKPLKRGMHSYHSSLGSINHSKIATHKASTSMNMQWMTHKTTFSQYNKENDAKFETATNAPFDHSANTFSMVPRRSISAPSSPKHIIDPLKLQRDSSLIDRLDLGDDDHSDHDDDDDNEDDEEEEEQTRDVLEDSDHSMDVTSVSDDESYDLRGHTRKKQSTKIIYGNTRSLRRRRLRRELKAKLNGTPLSEENSTDEPQQIDDDDLYDDTQESKSKSIQSESDVDEDEEDEEKEEQTYFRRRQRKKGRKQYLYKDDNDSDKDPEIIDSDDDDEEEEEEEEEDKNDEVIDLDEEQYEYYQRKKRNSKVHLLDKDEFEKEYNSILQ